MEKTFKEQVLVWFGLAAVLVLAVVFLFWYCLAFKVVSITPKMKPQAASHATSGAESISPADLETMLAEYQKSYALIMGDFFSAASTSANLAPAADIAQEKLLALSVTNENKGKHLQTVVLLGQISDLASKNNQTAIQDKLKALKAFAAK